MTEGLEALAVGMCPFSDLTGVSSAIFGSPPKGGLELDPADNPNAERGNFPQASGFGQEAQAGAAVIADEVSNARQNAFPKSSSLHAGQFDGSPEHVGGGGLICHILFAERREFFSGRGTEREELAVTGAGSGEGRRIWIGPVGCEIVLRRSGTDNFEDEFIFVGDTLLEELCIIFCAALVCSSAGGISMTADGVISVLSSSSVLRMFELCGGGNKYSCVNSETTLAFCIAISRQTQGVLSVHKPQSKVSNGGVPPKESKPFVVSRVGDVNNADEYIADALTDPEGVGRVVKAIGEYGAPAIPVESGVEAREGGEGT